MTLSDYIAAHRMTQDEFAELIGVTQPSVGRWIAGERMPRPDTLRRIAELTAGAVTANDFMAPPSDGAQAGEQQGVVG